MSDGPQFKLPKSGWALRRERCAGAWKAALNRINGLGFLKHPATLVIALIVIYWVGVDLVDGALAIPTGDDGPGDSTPLRRFMNYATGFAALVLMWLTWKRTKAVEERNRGQDEQIRIQGKQLNVAESGQLNDRFTTAVEQLAHDVFAVKLGGIYALERLAKDHFEYYETVFQVLTAYVRDRFPVEPGADEPVDGEPVELKFPVKEIQPILDVIGRRLRNLDEAESERREGAGIDLSRTYLRGMELSGAYLAEADLTGADLTGAKLTGANLCIANLRGADLTGAKLTDAYLAGANLTDANLTRADLTRANLNCADLNRADLEEANLPEAILTDAYLTDADLIGTNLTGADLTDANLSGADLNGALWNSTTTWPKDFTRPTQEPEELPPSQIPSQPAPPPPKPSEETEPAPESPNPSKS